MPLTKKEMVKATARVKRQVQNEPQLPVQKAETIEDPNAYKNPHKKPELKIAYTGKNTNFTAHTSMGASTKYFGKQEDRLYVGVLKIGTVNAKKIPNILYKANIEMGQECLKEEDERKKTTQELIRAGKMKPPSRPLVTAGSTAVAAVVYKNRVFVSNVGDSRAVLIKRKIDTDKPSKFHCERLTVTHSATDKKEQIRAARISGNQAVFLPPLPPFDKGPVRLNRMLAMTRAFGDNDVGPGLDYTPSIPLPIDIKDDEEEAYLVMFSDGIYESLNEKDLEKIFNENANNKNIADEIRQQAENKGSHDNKSVVVVPITQNKLKEDEAIFAMVADGHGGDQVSNYLAQNFPKVMQKQIDHTISDDEKKKDSDEESSHAETSENAKGKKSHKNKPHIKSSKEEVKDVEEKAVASEEDEENITPTDSSSEDEEPVSNNNKSKEDEENILPSDSSLSEDEEPVSNNNSNKRKPSKEKPAKEKSKRNSGISVYSIFANDNKKEKRALHFLKNLNLEEFPKVSTALSVLKELPKKMQGGFMVPPGFVEAVEGILRAYQEDKNLKNLVVELCIQMKFYQNKYEMTSMIGYQHPFYSDFSQIKGFLEEAWIKVRSKELIKEVGGKNINKKLFGQTLTFLQLILNDIRVSKKAVELRSELAMAKCPEDSQEIPKKIRKWCEKLASIELEQEINKRQTKDQCKYEENLAEKSSFGND